MALIAGAETFDRLFAGVRFGEVDGEDTVAKIEDEFALHISIIAAKLLEPEINIVMVLPRQLAN